MVLLSSKAKPFTTTIFLLTKQFPYDKHIEKPEHKEGKMNKLNTIFKSKDKEVIVMETNDFYKTELGQKVLADLHEKKWNMERWESQSLSPGQKEYIEIGDKYQDGYAIKRGDNYFLVNHNGKLPDLDSVSDIVQLPFRRDFIAIEDLYLRHEYCITPITKDGKVDACNRIEALIKTKFDYEDFSYATDGSVVFTATDLQKRFKAYVKHEESIFSKDGLSRNDDLFDKFIAPDPHWFECATHYGKRQEVLNGTARTVFNRNVVSGFLITEEQLRETMLPYRIKKLCDAVVAKRQMDKRIREL